MSAPSVLRSAKLIAICTLLSRITGLARELLMGQHFGLSWVQDAFVYAFQVPNLFRRLFGEGSLAPVFVPTFTHTLETEGKPAALALLARTLSLMTVSLVLMTILVELILLAVWRFVPVDPGQAEARRLLLSLTGLMLPFMLSICVLALLSSILNCVGSFVPAALAPIILNVVMVIAIQWVAPALCGSRPERQVYVIGASVLVAGVLQLVAIVPALRSAGVRLGWSFDWRSPTVRRMLRLLPPVALGQGVLAFGVFLDAQVCVLLTHESAAAPATHHLLGLTYSTPLAEGALSAVSYAQRLYQFPLGVLAISLATAALPEFSRRAARCDWAGWSEELTRSLRVSIFEGLAAGAMMIAVAEPIVRFLLQYGRFDAEDTLRTAHVLRWYGVGLWAFAAQQMVWRGFYSLHDVRTPLLISAAILPLNVGITLTLVWSPALREAAFAISSSTTSGIAVIAGMWILQRRTKTRLIDAKLAGALARMVLAAAVSLAASVWSAPRIAEMAGALHGVVLARAVECFGPLGLGVSCYLILAYVSRLPEPALLLGRRRSKGARVTAAV